MALKVATGDVDAGAGTAGLVATGSVTGLFQSGADVPLSYGFNTAGTLPAGLTSGGVALSYVDHGQPDHGDGRCWRGDGVHDGARTRRPGAWTFTLSEPLDHPTLDGLAGDNTENDLTINFGGLVQATDRRWRHGDGDRHGDACWSTTTCRRGSRHVDGHGRRGRAAGRHRRRRGRRRCRRTAGWSRPVRLTGLFQSGADVPLSYGFNTAGTLPAGLTSGGVALSYIITADLITATAVLAGRRCSRWRSTRRPGRGRSRCRSRSTIRRSTGWRRQHENDLTINFGSLVQATDRDGDTVTATGTVSVLVDDDTPAAVVGDVDGHGRRGRAAGRHCRRHRRRRPAQATGRDRFGDGPVPVGRGRSAELWLQHRRHAAGRADVGRGCAELHDHGQPDHGDGGAAQHGVHDGARRGDRERGRSRCRSRSTIRRSTGGATPRTT